MANQNYRRDNIEQVKLDAARITRQRLEADKENNPSLWEALGLNQGEPEPQPTNDQKKEGK